MQRRQPHTRMAHPLLVSARRATVRHPTVQVQQGHQHQQGHLHSHLLVLLHPQLNQLLCTSRARSESTSMQSTSGVLMVSFHLGCLGIPLAGCGAPSTGMLRGWCRMVGLHPFAHQPSRHSSEGWRTVRLLCHSPCMLSSLMGTISSRLGWSLCFCFTRI